MGAQFPGLKMGAVDPGPQETIGASASSATQVRRLMRSHLALIPAPLQRALSQQRNEERSKALSDDEIMAVCTDALPDHDDLEITGATVHGQEGSKDKWVGFTYRVGGRTHKAAVPYDDDNFPDSVEAGDEAVQVKKAKEAGLPWITSAMADSIRGEKLDGSAKDASKAEKALVKEQEKNADLQTQLDELKATVERMANATPAETAPDVPPAQDPGGPPVDVEAYLAGNIGEIKAKLGSDDPDQATLTALLAFEEKNQNRAGVTADLNKRLDAAAAAQE